MNGNLADFVIQSLMRQKGLGLPQAPQQAPQRAMFPDLQLLDQIDAPMAQTGGFAPPSQAPQQSMGGPAVGDISNKMQEWIGAKQPDEGNFPQQALSKRFEQQSQGPSFSDYSRAIQSSAYGKPANAQDFSSERINNELRQIQAMRQDVQRLPADVQSYQYYQNLPAEERPEFLKVKRASPDEVFAKTRGAGAAKLTLENQEATSAVDAINYGAQNALRILDDAKFTGRALAPIGNLVGDPDFDRLTSQINRLIPLFRVASKFPAAGFSDADAARLESALGNPKMTVTGLKQVLNDVITQGIARQQQYSQQNQALGSEFNYDNNQFNQQNVPPQMPEDDPYAKARIAVQSGADINAVKKRLQEAGYDPAEL